MRCKLYRKVKPKSQQSIEIGTLMNSRRLMIEQKVALINTVKTLLKTYGIRLKILGNSSCSQKARENFSEQYQLAQEGVKSLLCCFEKTSEEIKKLTKKIEIDDPRRFRTPRALRAYLCMTPHQCLFGENDEAK